MEQVKNLLPLREETLLTALSTNEPLFTFFCETLISLVDTAKKHIKTDPDPSQTPLLSQSLFSFLVSSLSNSCKPSRPLSPTSLAKIYRAASTCLNCGSGIPAKYRHQLSQVVDHGLTLSRTIVRGTQLSPDAISALLDFPSYETMAQSMLMELLSTESDLDHLIEILRSPLTSTFFVKEEFQKGSFGSMARSASPVFAGFVAKLLPHLLVQTGSGSNTIDSAILSTLMLNFISTLVSEPSTSVFSSLMSKNTELVKKITDKSRGGQKTHPGVVDEIRVYNQAVVDFFADQIAHECSAQNSKDESLISIPLLSLLFVPILSSVRQTKSMSLNIALFSTAVLISSINKMNGSDKSRLSTLLFSFLIDPDPHVLDQSKLERSPLLQAMAVLSDTQSVQEQWRTLSKAQNPGEIVQLIFDSLHTHDTDDSSQKSTVISLSIFRACLINKTALPETSSLLSALILFFVSVDLPRHDPQSPFSHLAEVIQSVLGTSSLVSLIFCIFDNPALPSILACKHDSYPLTILYDDIQSILQQIFLDQHSKTLQTRKETQILSKLSQATMDSLLPLVNDAGWPSSLAGFGSSLHQNAPLIKSDPEYVGRLVGQNGVSDPLIKTVISQSLRAISEIQQTQHDHQSVEVEANRLSANLSHINCLPSFACHLAACCDCFKYSLLDLQRTSQNDKKLIFSFVDAFFGWTKLFKSSTALDSDIAILQFAVVSVTQFILDCINAFSSEQQSTILLSLLNASTTPSFLSTVLSSALNSLLSIITLTSSFVLSILSAIIEGSQTSRDALSASTLTLKDGSQLNVDSLAQISILLQHYSSAGIIDTQSGPLITFLISLFEKLSTVVSDDHVAVSLKSDESLLQFQHVDSVFQRIVQSFTHHLKTTAAPPDSLRSLLHSITILSDSPHKLLSENVRHFSLVLIQTALSHPLDTSEFKAVLPKFISLQIISLMSDWTQSESDSSSTDEALSQLRRSFSAILSCDATRRVSNGIVNPVSAALSFALFDISKALPSHLVVPIFSSFADSLYSLHQNQSDSKQHSLRMIVGQILSVFLSKFAESEGLDITKRKTPDFSQNSVFQMYHRFLGRYTPSEQLDALAVLIMNVHAVIQSQSALGETDVTSITPPHPLHAEKITSLSDLCSLVSNSFASHEVLFDQRDADVDERIDLPVLATNLSGQYYSSFVHAISTFVSGHFFKHSNLVSDIRKIHQREVQEKVEIEDSINSPCSEFALRVLFVASFISSSVPGLQKEARHWSRSSQLKLQNLLNLFIHPLADKQSGNRAPLIQSFDGLVHLVRKIKHGLSEVSDDSEANALHWASLFEDFPTPFISQLILLQQPTGQQQTPKKKKASKSGSMSSLSDMFTDVFMKSKALYSDSKEEGVVSNSVCERSATLYLPLLSDRLSTVIGKNAIQNSVRVAFGLEEIEEEERKKKKENEEGSEIDDEELEAMLRDDPDAFGDLNISEDESNQNEDEEELQAESDSELASSGDDSSPDDDRSQSDTGNDNSSGDDSDNDSSSEIPMEEMAIAILKGSSPYSLLESLTELISTFTTRPHSTIHKPLLALFNLLARLSSLLLSTLTQELQGEFSFSSVHLLEAFKPVLDQVTQSMLAINDQTRLSISKVLKESVSGSDVSFQTLVTLSELDCTCVDALASVYAFLNRADPDESLSSFSALLFTLQYQSSIYSKIVSGALFEPFGVKESVNKHDLATKTLLALNTTVDCLSTLIKILPGDFLTQSLLSELPKQKTSTLTLLLSQLSSPQLTASLRRAVFLQPSLHTASKLFPFFFSSEEDSILGKDHLLIPTEKFTLLFELNPDELTMETSLGFRVIQFLSNIARTQDPSDILEIIQAILKPFKKNRLNHSLSVDYNPLRTESSVPSQPLTLIPSQLNILLACLTTSISALDVSKKSVKRLINNMAEQLITSIAPSIISLHQSLAQSLTSNHLDYVSPFGTLQLERNIRETILRFGQAYVALCMKMDETRLGHWYQQFFIWTCGFQAESETDTPRVDSHAISTVPFLDDEILPRLPLLFSTTRLLINKCGVRAGKIVDLYRPLITAFLAIDPCTLTKEPDSEDFKPQNLALFFNTESQYSSALGSVFTLLNEMSVISQHSADSKLSEESAQSFVKSLCQQLSHLGLKNEQVVHKQHSTRIAKLRDSVWSWNLKLGWDDFIDDGGNKITNQVESISQSKPVKRKHREVEIEEELENTLNPKHHPELVSTLLTLLHPSELPLLFGYSVLSKDNYPVTVFESAPPLFLFVSSPTAVLQPESETASPTFTLSSFPSALAALLPPPDSILKTHRHNKMAESDLLSLPFAFRTVGASQHPLPVMIASVLSTTVLSNPLGTETPEGLKRWIYSVIDSLCLAVKDLIEERLNDTQVVVGCLYVLECSIRAVGSINNAFSPILPATIISQFVDNQEPAILEAANSLKLVIEEVIGEKIDDFLNK
ncbi:hypothetical protein BLNAU_10360 [Blattamonas nauphoetae]|uniref:HECT-type E3 ubiquitin transferase n=1 Tax=Blattamonas nauphoetae TaxID=2049346 RepID=A0ABQ9XT89_9EUKA|nr:hypothetical protein BLNAU_10360 [Blattamonas nauphoetae]